MKILLLWITLGVCAYLLGSIPFGFLIAKARGVDIRTVGSKNIGATNVFRTVGKGAGIAAFALDAGKGFLAVMWGGHLAPQLFDLDLGLLLQLKVFSGACAIVGHNWTCFLGFKGGKGVATSLGVVLGLVWLGALFALGIWMVVVLVSRYVSLASIIAAAALGVGVWFLYPQEPAWFLCVLSAFALLAILKHHANIRRLFKGEENRISWSKKK